MVQKVEGEVKIKHYVMQPVIKSEKIEIQSVGDVKLEVTTKGIDYTKSQAFSSYNDAMKELITNLSYHGITYGGNVYPPFVKSVLERG